MEYVTLKEAYGPYGLKNPKKVKEDKQREEEREKKDVERRAETIQGFKPGPEPWNGNMAQGPVSPWGTGNTLAGTTLWAEPAHTNMTWGRYRDQNNWQTPARQEQPNHWHAWHQGNQGIRRERFSDVPSFEEDVKRTIALGLFGLLLIFAMDHVCSQRRGA